MREGLGTLGSVPAGSGGGQEQWGRDKKFHSCSILGESSAEPEDADMSRLSPSPRMVTCQQGACPQPSAGAAGQLLAQPRPRLVNKPGQERSPAGSSWPEPPPLLEGGNTQKVMFFFFPRSWLNALYCSASESWKNSTWALRGSECPCSLVLSART